MEINRCQYINNLVKGWAINGIHSPTITDQFDDHRIDAACTLAVANIKIISFAFNALVHNLSRSPGESPFSEHNFVQYHTKRKYVNFVAVLLNIIVHFRRHVHRSANTRLSASNQRIQTLLIRNPRYMAIDSHREECLRVSDPDE